MLIVAEYGLFKGAIYVVKHIYERKNLAIWDNFGNFVEIFTKNA
jgi:hypothetical protein